MGAVRARRRGGREGSFLSFQALSNPKSFAREETLRNASTRQRENEEEEEEEITGNCLRKND
jgi:hypothetical protein